MNADDDPPHAEAADLNPAPQPDGPLQLPPAQEAEFNYVLHKWTGNKGIVGGLGGQQWVVGGILDIIRSCRFADKLANDMTLPNYLGGLYRHVLVTYTPAKMPDSPERHLFFIQGPWGGVVGFLLLDYIYRTLPSDQRFKGHEYHLTAYGVHKSRVGKGLGIKLLQAALNFIEGSFPKSPCAKCLSGEIHKDNVPSLQAFGKAAHTYQGRKDDTWMFYVRKQDPDPRWENTNHVFLFREDPVEGTLETFGMQQEGATNWHKGETANYREMVADNPANPPAA